MATNARLTNLPVEITGPGSGDQRLTDLPVEITGPGSGDQRVTALPVEVTGPGSGDQRLTALTVEVVAPQTVPSVLRVTETGALSAQGKDELRVTETGSLSAQGKDELFVTQIGLLVLYGPAAPEPPQQPPPAGESCPIDIPSVERWADDVPTVSCLGEDDDRSVSLWDPEFATATSSQYWADRHWAPRYWSNYWGVTVAVAGGGACIIERPYVTLFGFEAP